MQFFILKLDISVSPLGYKAPRAGPLRLYTTKTFHLAAVGFVWLCSIIGMIIALAFLYVNIRYKEEA